MVTDRVLAEKLTLKEISKISGKTLTKINQAIGFRLVTKFGEKGLFNLWKLVPFIGAPISATVDFFFCYSVGRLAKGMFGPDKADFARTKFLPEAKDVLESATKMAVKTGREAVVRQMEESKEKKDTKKLVKALENLLVIGENENIAVVQHRKEMILEKGPIAREYLVEFAIAGDERFQTVARELLVQLCEPEDEILTKHLNNKNEDAKRFIFSVLVEILNDQAPTS